MLQVQRLPLALPSLLPFLPSPRFAASHFRPPAASCACIYEQQNNNKMIIFRLVSICPQTPRSPALPYAFVYSFFFYKVENCRQHCLLFIAILIWNLFYAIGYKDIHLHTQANTLCLAWGLLPTLPSPPSPAAPRPLPTCPAVIKGTTNDLFLPCFINIKCLTMTRAAPVLYEWINICLVLSARTLALALMINIQLAAFALIAFFRLFIAVFVDLYTPFAV